MTLAGPTGPAHTHDGTTYWQHDICPKCRQNRVARIDERSPLGRHFVAVRHVQTHFGAEDPVSFLNTKTDQRALKLYERFAGWSWDEWLELKQRIEAGGC